MPKSTCDRCGGVNLYWRWEEAFDKFGFGDGDGQVMTHVVEHVLRAAGYVVSSEPWGLHNITTKQCFDKAYWSALEPHSSVACLV